MSKKNNKLALTVFFALALSASSALAKPIEVQIINPKLSDSTHSAMTQNINNHDAKQGHKREQKQKQEQGGGVKDQAKPLQNDVSSADNKAAIGNGTVQNTSQENAQNTPKQVDQTLPEIKKIGDAYSFTLKNGLQVVVLPNHRAPVVTQMVWYRVGSADESAGHTGIAHFLEHLMFKGTKQYKGDEFNQTVSRLGGQQNAFTSYDYTAYYQSVATPYLEEMMKREADRMLNLVLSEDDIKSERQVIIEERRMRTDNSPEAMLSEETRATLFLNSPYHNPVIGWKQEMETLSRNDALNFYHRFYTPNNATLILAGDIVPEQAREFALAIYGPLEQRSNTPQVRIRPQEPVSRTQRTVTMRDPRLSTESFQHLWVVPSYNNAKQGQAEALDLLGEILGGSQRSRLYTKLVVEQGKAASIGSVYSGNSIDDGIFYVYGIPRNDVSLAQLQQDVTAIIADIAKNGVSQAELNQARERFIRSIVYAKDSPVKLANIYGAALSTGQTLDDINQWPERLKKVTPEAIKQMAKAYLDDNKGVVSYLMPPKDSKLQKNDTKSNANQKTDAHKQK